MKCKGLLVWLLLSLLIFYPLVFADGGSSSDQLSLVVDSSAGELGVALRWNVTLLGERTNSAPTIVDFDLDGEQEIIVESLISDAIGERESILYCLNHDGSIRWQHSLEDHLSWFPTVVDLELDGELEILTGSFSSSGVYCFTEHGSLKWFFADPWSINGGFAVADLFRNGTFEIIFGSYGGTVYCLSSEGEELWHYNPEGGSVRATPAIADLDADGFPEILIGVMDDFYSSTSYFYCLSHNGTLEWDFALYNLFEHDFNPAAIGDLEGDGSLEIIFTSWGKGWLYCLNASGGRNWQYQFAADLPDYNVNSAALADLTGDGSLEILVGSCDGFLHCLACDGSLLWKYDTKEWVGDQPIVADLTNDSQLEIIFSSHQKHSQKESTLYCLDCSGELLWKYSAAYSLGLGRGSTTVADLEGDGLFEIICPQYKAKTVCCFELTGIDSSGVAAPWACFQGSLFRTGWGDSDSDLIDDFTEGWTFGTDPSNPDSDGDSYSDGEECLSTTDPLNPLDFPIWKPSWVKPVMLSSIVIGTFIFVSSPIITMVVILRWRKKKRAKESLDINHEELIFGKDGE